MKFQQYFTQGSFNDLIKISYITNVEKEEIPCLDVLSNLLLEGTVTLENKIEFNKNLFRNFGSSLLISITTISNKLCLTFITESINKKYIDDSYDIKENVIDILFDTINNAKILSRDITDKRVSIVKNKILNSMCEDTSTEALIEEINYRDYNYEESLMKVTLEDIRNLYIKILTKGRVVVQEITDEENDILIEKVKKSMCKSTEENNKIEYKSLPDDICYVEKNSDLDNTRLDFVLQCDKEITSRNNEIIDVVEEVLNEYMFRIIREENCLSYNPRAYYNIDNNTIVLSANIEKHNKDKTLELMYEIANDFVNGNIDDRLLRRTLKKINNIKMFRNMSNYDLSEIHLENEILGITDVDEEQITIDEIKQYAKDHQLKIIYYLGGN